MLTIILIPSPVVKPCKKEEEPAIASKLVHLVFVYLFLFVCF